MSRKPALFVAGAVGVVVAAYAVRKLLERDEIRERLGLPPLGEKEVDVASSDSFPASDPPSFTRSAA
ncbi:hypothetical protein EON79_01455 [bacterium]|nr:MAG: hypothetical protein EON79_01455 [bacterium]